MRFSSLQVSIEYGLCEIMSSPTINLDSVPKNDEWFPEPSELEIALPAGSIDHSTQRVHNQVHNFFIKGLFPKI